METFAPAYFDYMSSSVSANVCYHFPFFCSFLTPIEAPNPFGKGFRVL